MVFDGYNRSPKDHDHIRRTKNSCCNLQIRPDMFNWTPRAKFLDNTHNKSELIHLLSSTFRKHHITVEQCDNDADTSIVAPNDTAYKWWSCHSRQELLCKLCRTLPPPAMGARFTVFGHAGHADPLDGWRCCSQKRVMSRPIQVRQH